MFTVLVFVIVLGILVFVHELGHFWVKMLGDLAGMIIADPLKLVGPIENKIGGALVNKEKYPLAATAFRETSGPMEAMRSTGSGSSASM